MSGHLSQLVLDELASDLAVEPQAKEHVGGCAHCAEQLAATRRAREASMKSFGWARTRARLTAERPSRLRELMPFLVPVLAALLFFFVLSLDFTSKKPDTRLKGAASIEFVRAGVTVNEVVPGDRLQLKVGAAGHTHALVLAVDKDRRVEQLWAGPLPPGALVTLRELEVTLGSVTVHAFLSNAPLEPRVVVPALEAAMKDYGGWPLEAPPPQLAGVTVATQRLYVKP